jgi:hypothetical protein
MEIVFAPFSNSALRATASLLAAAIITVAGMASPGVVETSDLLDSPTASTSTESASPIRQIAKPIEGMVQATREAIEQKKEAQDEIEKSLQPGQRSVPPPEKP